MKHRYPIFVSSLCKELKDLREKLWLSVGKEKYIYVDECARPRGPDTLGQLDAVDDLIARIREADTFVCILGGSRHGFPISIDGIETSVSFFEIELYQAALLGKPIHLFVRDDFAPEPRLEELLRILRFAFPRWRTVRRLTDNGIKAEIRKLVGRRRVVSALMPVPVLRRPINRLVQALYTGRARHVAGPSVFFLHDAGATTGKVPDEQIIQKVLAVLEPLRDEEKRLSRLWLGIRELLYAHYRRTDDPELLGYWDRLLAEWARAGAWYGLHGDLPLGCLAGLNSVTAIRNRIAGLHKGSSPKTDTSYPGGALASAKYSIGKKLFVREDRTTRLTEALDDINRMITGRDVEFSGDFAIRGSIYRQLGQRAAALTDYETVLALRRIDHADDPAIGDALSELAFGYLQDWQLRRALEYSEEGVALLRSGQTAGFLARGLRKQALIYLANGRILEAYDAWVESQSIAQSSGSYDQL